MDYGAKVSCISARFGLPPQQTVCLVLASRGMVRRSILLQSKKHLPQRRLLVAVRFPACFESSYCSNDCLARSLGTVFFPAGHTFLTTQFQFESSNTALYVSGDAVIMGSDDISAWTKNLDFITANNLHNIMITGPGVINGQGKGML